jgi:methionyl-tRNA synthetase
MFARINSDLANDLGNLVSRTTAMVIKYFDGTLPEDKEFTDADNDLLEQLGALPDFVSETFETMRFSEGLAKIFSVIARANKYIDENEPWKLAKDETAKPRLAAVLYNLLDAIRRVAILLEPVMPHTSPKIFEQIGADESNTTWEASKARHALAASVTVTKGEVLFPRIDIDKEIDELNKMFPSAEEEKGKDLEPLKPLTKFDNFAALDLRAVKVLSCEKVEKSDKLLKFKVDDGFGERQVLSGIAKYYKPEDLIGKTLAMIVNLEPRKMMGLESNGMILSVKYGDGYRVVEFDDSVLPGSDIS